MLTTRASASLHTRCPSAGSLAALAGLLLLAGLVTGCSPDGLLGNTPLPPDVPDPAQLQTATGALEAYRGALIQLKAAVGGRDESFIPVTGLFTDELQAADRGLVGDVRNPLLVDSRFLPEYHGTDRDLSTPVSITRVYGLLQQVRGQAREARGALRAYVADSLPALTGHLDAIEGYADVFLADFFCSGIPLSTLDFGGDYTYQPGSTTEQVYQHAVSLFDSALAVAADSDRILNLARVGKGRALLALGQYTEAAAAVEEVPDGFQYALHYNGSASNRSFVWNDFGWGGSLELSLTMADIEGGNGLPYLASGDPRTAGIAAGTGARGLAVTSPGKYSADGDSPIVLAGWIEARLIQAEAALTNTDDASWLTTLNTLRTDGTFTTAPPDSVGHVDTLWNAGTGGIAGLRPLDDPGTQEGRVNLLFQERAFWLYLTGHRQGDLRRLIRQYARDPQTVYPTGGYVGAYGNYGSDVTAPIPGDERIANPRFHGCINRGA